MYALSFDSVLLSPEASSLHSYTLYLLSGNHIHFHALNYHSSSPWLPNPPPQVLPEYIQMTIGCLHLDITRIPQTQFILSGLVFPSQIFFSHLVAEQEKSLLPFPRAYL